MSRRSTVQTVRRQLNDRVLAQLHDAEANVEVERQTLWANLIEGGATSVRSRQLDELFDESGPFLAWSDRIEQGDPASPPLVEHQKSSAAV